MPKPPAPRERRRSRKRVLFDYMARWHEPGLGLDLGESMHLQALGYGGWLARGRLTDVMTVELIAYTLSDLEDHVINIAPTWSERLARMIEGLMHRRIRPGGLTTEEGQCLAALAGLGCEYERVGGDRLRGYTTAGKAVYDPPPEHVINAYTTISETFPDLMKQLAERVRETFARTDEVNLGGRYAPTIRFGLRSSAVTKLAALRADLGKGYLDPNSTLAYRKACVPKWKQAALAHAIRDEEAHRLLVEHNRRARELHRAGGRPPANSGALLIV